MDCKCILEDLEKCKEFKIGGCTQSHFVGITLAHSHAEFLAGSTMPSVRENCMCEEGFKGATLPCDCPKPEILYDKLQDTVLLFEQVKKVNERADEQRKRAKEQLQNQKKSLEEELKKINDQYELVKDKELHSLKEFLSGRRINLETNIQLTNQQISYFS